MKGFYDFWTTRHITLTKSGYHNSGKERTHWHINHYIQL